MSKIFLVDLEAVETRYTSQWKTHVPKLLQDAGHSVHVISGPTDIPSATTPGAFLNFGGTNVYKANQVEQIGRLFCSGQVQPGSHFIFTDAWHPGIINLKYMSELLGIPVVTHGLWHAGSYDPEDFLGRLVGDKPWVRHAEQSFYYSYDHNYFATKFHIDLFFGTLLCKPDTLLCEGWYETHVDHRIIRTGWPMEYITGVLKSYRTETKRDLILFPHRIAPEKQVGIFKDLAKQMPEYSFVVCQEQELTKHQYHSLLGQAKMVFSANLQETLGISCFEGLAVGAMALVPDRLSYTEMYPSEFKYPSEWTQNWDSYIAHRDELVQKIRTMMTNYDTIATLSSIEKTANHLQKEYFSATGLIDNINTITAQRQ